MQVCQVGRHAHVRGMAPGASAIGLSDQDADFGGAAHDVWVLTVPNCLRSYLERQTKTVRAMLRPYVSLCLFTSRPMFRVFESTATEGAMSLPGSSVPRPTARNSGGWGIT
jgi:hypothetical protein